MLAGVFRGGYGALLAICVSVLSLLSRFAPAQIAPPTIETTSRIGGAIPSQLMDSGVLPAIDSNPANVTDSFAGPVQVGTLTIGTANVAINASSRAGLIRMSAQTSDAASIAAVAVTASTEANAFDSVQITNLPGGQGQLSALYFPAMLATGCMITGDGGTWSGTVRLTVNIQDYASDGTLRAGYALGADYTKGTLGSAAHDTGPVTVPVQLNDTVTFDVDETLETSATASRAGMSGVNATVTTRLLIVPMSPGLALASASGGGYLPLTGDANADGKVDFSDLLTLAQHYGSTDAAWPEGDFNADGTVGFDDLLALAQSYGQSIDSSQVAAVPEPSVIAPATLALAGILRCRRRP